MEKKIKAIYVYGMGLNANTTRIESDKDGTIEIVKGSGMDGLINWYEKGQSRYNSNYVVAITYF